MKIAFVVISLYGGGAEKSNLNIIRMLMDLGCEVDVYSILNKENTNTLKSEINFNVLKGNRIAVFSKMDKFFQLRSFLKRKKYDLIIDGRTRPSFYKELIFQKIIYATIVNRIFLVHNSKLDDYLFDNTSLSDFFYQKHRFVCVSKHVKNKLVERYGYKNVHYIQNTFGKSISNTEANHSLSFPYILFYGRLEDYAKDIRFLIDAYKDSNLSKEGVRFVIMGSGPSEETLEEYVNNIHFSEYILFYPFQSSPYEIVKNAICTVMASRYEGFPMTIIESLALEVPVVTTDFESGPSEIIVSGYNGILVKEKTIENFSRAIEKMTFNADFRGNCVKNTRTSITPFEYSVVKEAWRKIIEQYEKN